jgi:hypothetical protein
LKVCIICTAALHKRIIVAAFIIKAFPLDSMETEALFMLGILYSGNSIMKKERACFSPVILTMTKALVIIIAMPTKYIRVPTQAELSKNTPANNAITGSLAPQGINGVNIAVVLLCLSFLMVLVAMIPGIAQPVPIIIGMIDLPERPTFLKNLSITTATLAM